MIRRIPTVWRWTRKGPERSWRKTLSAAKRWQERLYAQHRWAVLVIFQAMGTAGKDSAIKHVMSGINPQGCEVQGSRRPRTSITIFCGGRRLGCQGGSGSASSTAPVTKKRGMKRMRKALEQEP